MSLYVCTVAASCEAKCRSSVSAFSSVVVAGLPFSLSKSGRVLLLFQRDFPPSRDKVLTRVHAKEAPFLKDDPNVLMAVSWTMSLYRRPMVLAMVRREAMCMAQAMAVLIL